MLVQDLRYAIRQLRKAPGFSLTAVLTLALGIGANSTILSWISGTLFDPIPGAKDTDRMVTLQRGERSEHPSPALSYPDFADLRENNKALSGLIGYHDDYISITGSARPERIYGVLATADYFEVLGVKPILGSTLISTRTNERVIRALWARRSSSTGAPIRLWALRRRVLEAARADCAPRFFCLWDWMGRFGVAIVLIAETLPGSTCWAYCGPESTRTRPTKS